MKQQEGGANNGGQELAVAKNQVDQCIFCSPEPCQCGRPVRQTATRKPPRQDSTPVESTAPPKTEVREQVRIPGAAQSSFTRAAPGPAPVVREALSDEERSLGRALTCLAEAGLLPEEELTKHRRKIDLPSWKIDALIWKSQT